jgi:hypothetical protein
MDPSGDQPLLTEQETHEWEERDRMNLASPLGTRISVEPGKDQIWMGSSDGRRERTYYLQPACIPLEDDECAYHVCWRGDGDWMIRAHEFGEVVAVLLAMFEWCLDQPLASDLNAAMPEATTLRRTRLSTNLSVDRGSLVSTGRLTLTSFATRGSSAGPRGCTATAVAVYGAPELRLMWYHDAIKLSFWRQRDRGARMVVYLGSRPPDHQWLEVFGPPSTTFEELFAMALYCIDEREVPAMRVVS